MDTFVGPVIFSNMIFLGSRYLTTHRVVHFHHICHHNRIAFWDGVKKSTVEVIQVVTKLHPRSLFRSLNHPKKGHLTIPKRAPSQNCQVHFYGSHSLFGSGGLAFVLAEFLEGWGESCFTRGEDTASEDQRMAEIWFLTHVNRISQVICW